MPARSNDAYGEGYADIYDDWYPAGPDAEAAAELLASLAADGPVLELGVGTGRIATLLVARGLQVWGIDSSAQMLAELGSKPGCGAVRAVHGDMAALDLPADAPPFALVFAAFNTLLCLPDRETQLACLRRVASVLAPTGCVVIEALVPTPPPPDRRLLEVASVEADRVVLKVSEWLPGCDAVHGHHVELGDHGVRLRPWRLQLLTCGQLDRLAEAAHLRLTDRFAGWAGEPFTACSRNQVSVYTRTGSATG